MKTGYTVMDLMTTKPITANRDMFIKDAAILMQEHNINSILIVENERPVGIVTDEDFVRKIVAKGLDQKKLRINDIMITDLISIAPEKDVYDALLLMRAHNIRQLPVVNKEKKFIGYLTLKDVLKIQPDLFELIAERYEIREYDRKYTETVNPEDDFFSKINIFKKKKK